MRFVLISATSLVCLFSATPVEAQTKTSTEVRIAEAKEAFEAGARAYANGDFETALRRFEHAYELTGSPDLLYNIATVSDRMRLDEEALEAYHGYLRARPDSADREHVQSRIAVLRQAIEARRQAELEADIEARKAAFRAAAQVKAERPLTEYVGPGPGPWITIGAGSTTMVVGAVLLGLGRRDQSKVDHAPPGSSYSNVQEMADRAPKRTKSGIALMSAGGAAVIGGVIWQLTGGHQEAMPEVGIGPSGVTIKGTF